MTLLVLVWLLVVGLIGIKCTSSTLSDDTVNSRLVVEVVVGRARTRVPNKGERCSRSSLILAPPLSLT